LNVVRTIGACGLFALLAACGSLRTEHVVTGTPRAPREGEVTVVMQGQAPPPDFEEVAIVQTVGIGIYSSLEDVVDGLRTRARMLGCDTVINVRIDSGTSSTSASAIAGVRSY
jgi:hypothetical protein